MSHHKSNKTWKPFLKKRKRTISSNKNIRLFRFFCSALFIQVRVNTTHCEMAINLNILRVGIGLNYYSRAALLEKFCFNSQTRCSKTKRSLVFDCRVFFKCHLASCRLNVTVVFSDFKQNRSFAGLVFDDCTIPGPVPTRRGIITTYKLHDPLLGSVGILRTTIKSFTFI